MHELAHVYLVAATDKRVPVNEVYSVNSCLGLKADEQRYMPNNYVFYVGSRSTLFVYGILSLAGIATGLIP